MTNRRNQRSGRSRGEDDRMSDASLDQAYGQRARGNTQVNWAAVGVIVTLIGTMFSFIWMAATQNAAITANHNTETTAIATTNAAVTQLQLDKKDNDKQMVEILLHLSSMDQTLKTILTYGVPRAVMSPEQSPIGGGNTIIQQAPSNGSKQLDR
jgi:hypothetical protein